MQFVRNDIKEIQKEFFALGEFSKGFNNFKSITEKYQEINPKVFQKFYKKLEIDKKRFLSECPNVNPKFADLGNYTELYICCLGKLLNMNFDFTKVDSDREHIHRVLNERTGKCTNVIDKYHDLYYNNNMSIEVKTSEASGNIFNKINDHIKRIRTDQNGIEKKYNGSNISRYFIMTLYDDSDNKSNSSFNTFFDLEEQENPKSDFDKFFNMNFDVLFIYDLLLKEVLWLNDYSYLAKNAGMNLENIVCKIEQMDRWEYPNDIHDKWNI